MITGGAAGIGKATALEFARNGARVAIAYIDDAQGAATVAEIETMGGEATCVHADVSRFRGCACDG